VVEAAPLTAPLTGPLDAIVEQAVRGGDLVAAAVAVTTPRGTYATAAGEATAGRAMTPDTVVWIASMTKAITTAAVMALVEQGLIDLRDPGGRYVPFLADLSVLEGFDAAGDPVLRPAARPVTVHDLLTHTSGFGYEFADAQLARYMAERRVLGRARYEQPLLFDPGERWAYGIGIDWAGQIVEAVTGERLDRHLERTVLGPLAMADTTFALPGAAPVAVADMYTRGPDGLVAVPFEMVSDPKFVPGGSGLFGTVADYLRFTRMILGQGALDGVRVLAPGTVAAMAANAIGTLPVTGWRTANPAYSHDVDFFPGMHQGWGLSFLINTETTPEGRRPGSLGWGGLANTYYWIDPAAQIAGVFATQVLPFFDPPAVATCRAVERAVYASL